MDCHLINSDLNLPISDYHTIKDECGSFPSTSANTHYISRNDEFHDTEHSHLHKNLTKKIGLAPLVVLIFYSVSGGPFGIEDIVRAGGPFYALLGLNCCVHYLCLRGWFCVFYVGHIDKIMKSFSML
jgi:hypothetical protein